MSYPTEYRVPWSARGLKYTEGEIASVVEVMKNSDTLTQGKYQLEFEKQLSSYLGGGQCFALATGTAALEISAMLCGLKPGDEVIMPAHTFAATAIPFARTGAKLIWADINPDTFVVSSQTIAPLINSKTKAIVVVHLYGLAAEMQPIVKLASDHGLFLIEDAAQSLGAKIDEKMTGTFGDFGCFSFHSHKNMTTLGEGGAIWVKDPERAALVRGIRHNGLRPFAEPRDRYWIPAMSNLDFDLDGVWPYNFCISEAQCALGVMLLKRLNQINSERRSRYQRIREALSDFPELEFQRIDNEYQSVYHLLPARFTHPSVTRDDLIELLSKEYGVKCVVQYYPLYRYPMFKKAGFGEADCKQTDDFFDNMISFPFQHWMTPGQEQILVELVKDAIESFR